MTLVLMALTSDSTLECSVEAIHALCDVIAASYYNSSETIHLDNTFERGWIILEVEVEV